MLAASQRMTSMSAAAAVAAAERPPWCEFTPNSIAAWLRGL